jgi:hypothetical protein
MSDKAIKLPSTTRDEVEHWFFEDYLPTWVGVGAGTIEHGPEFILDYWGVPLHWGLHPASQWLLDGPTVVGFLQQMQTRLQSEGYAYTAVPDQRVAVYHRDGAAIEVIWSRRRADDSEIERLAAHFELARGPEGWRIVGIQAIPTASDTLNSAWQQAN